MSWLFETGFVAMVGFFVCLVACGLYCSWRSTIEEEDEFTM
jgi:hypothetical protein